MLCIAILAQNEPSVDTSVDSQQHSGRARTPQPILSMASLFKRGDWYYASFFDKNRTPKRKQVALRTKHKREAERLLHELEDRHKARKFDPWLDAGEQSTSDLGTLKAAVDAFIWSRSNLSRYTITKYQSVLGLFVQCVGGSVPVDRITPEQVQRFLNSTNKQPITKKTYTSTLSPFFNWLVEQEAIQENPTKRLRLERVPSKFPRFLSPADVDAICSAIRRTQDEKHAGADTGAWLIPIIQANVYLGLRAGELVNLRWEHVDLERRLLRVANTETFRTKSGKERVLPLCDAVVNILAAYDRGGTYVFPNYSGGQLHRQYLSRAFKHYARKAGLHHVNFHSTRHTAASWLAQQRCGVEAIRLYMGHSSVTVTQRYMHLSPQSFHDQINQAFAPTRRLAITM